MDSSESLKLDENLARFLAAYDQRIEGGDANAATVSVPQPPGPPSADERQVSPLHGAEINEGSMGEVLPDSRPGGPESPPHGQPRTAPSGPHRIGRFELRRQLGKGGCGIVFLAYDPKLLREVALKIPRPELFLNADARRRLLREALAAAEFDHPNLVPVYETGEVGPVCFIATAFCPGQTLAGWLDRQAFPVPVRQAARLIAIVADAVQHAHDRGVLHRDLKPNNVILQELRLAEGDEPPPGSAHLRGEHYLPRVVDFGLAKLLERGGPSETATRQVLGTPKYMAPEQAQARREDIGPTADVYALGVMLYELIAGRAPYDGPTDVEILRQAVEGNVTPPRHIRPDIPRDLEAICLKAMARDTSKRYRTAIDLADDLRRFLDGLPTLARPLSWSARAVRWFRRNDELVAIVGLTVIAVFVTVLASWISYRTEQFRNDRDTAQIERSREQAERNRIELQREYARQVRAAFHAWRGGNPEAAGSLEAARRASTGLTEPPDFAHDYLARVVKAPRLMIVCPAGPVTALAVSPDGTRLASGHADGMVAVWDRATGQQLDSVKAHTQNVHALAFGLDGSALVTGGQTNQNGWEMTGWDVAKTGALTRRAGDRQLPGQQVRCFAVSPDGKHLYAALRGKVMRVNLADPREKLDLDRAGPDLVRLAVSFDGQKVLTADAAGVVLRWTADLKPDDLRSYEFSDVVTALAPTYAGLPAVGFQSGTVWHTEPMCRPLIFRVPHPVRWLATTSNGSVAVNTSSGCVSLDRFDLPTGDTGDVRAGVYAPDGKTLFTGGDDGVIRSWDTVRDPHVHGATASGTVGAVAVAKDGGRFAIASDSLFNTFETATGKEGYFSTHKFRAAVLLDDGTMRGVTFEGATVIVADPTGNTQDERLRFALPAGRVPVCAALSPDGAAVAVGDDAGQVHVWSVANRETLGVADTGARRPVGRVTFRSDGKYFAAPISTGVGVWVTASLETAATVPADDQAAFCFLGEDRIVTAGRDGAVRVWTFGGKEQVVLLGHVGRVTGLGASPDGRTLVSAGLTGEVKFWDLRTGQELLGVRRHTGPVTHVEFAAGGKVLVTAGPNQYAVWDARPE